ncbi:MAG: glycoside hydrolase family 92 protein, partial [Bacteroidetes bacterium]|nr:glycoside hydrolase family 92 protein [Bacteroidota bacterium]
MKKVLPLLAAIVFLASCTIKVDKDFTKYVDPFIGTGGHGHTYPGACMPFGMVQLSPDTRLEGWDGCSGYHYSDSVIYGFSHTHLSGTGASDYGDILFMPTTGKVILDNGYKKSYDSGYCSMFSHANEQARPGFYHVKLDKYQVDVDLTVTRRAGFHKYTFPKTAEANIIIDLVHRDQVLDASLEMVSDTEVAGFRRSRHWASDQRIYFVARFSRPFKSSGISRNDTLLDGIKTAAGKSVKGFLRFESQGNDPLLVKVGISAVSIEGARKNLEAEIPGWDFEKVIADANVAWNKELGKIQVEGGNREQIRAFYTSLYHAMLAPNLFMDVDGQYLGRDLLPHQADGFDYYTVFSLWDTYRAAHPLYTILDQKRTVDFIQTFIRQYEEGGLLPVWELGANETWCMIGYHAVPVIADAYMKGIRDYDAEKAFEACLNSARKDHLGLASYKKYGYIQGFDEGESVSKTLEYAYDDWTIAQMAQQMGRQAEYEEFIQRAQYYKNVYDPTTGFMRAKMNGTWFTPFDPFEVNFNYTEANSWQYSFYVPQDVSGLIRYMGGDDAFADRLDKLFTASTQTTGLDQADITGLIGQYAHGNEPSHHMAYLYAYAGKAWETQRVTRKIMDSQYSDQHDGLCGNEDCGQMSAWYVLSAMGFYPV